MSASGGPSPPQHLDWCPGAAAGLTTRKRAPSQSGGQESEVEVPQGCAPSRDSREGSSLSPPASGGSRCSLACGDVAPTPAFVFALSHGHLCVSQIFLSFFLMLVCLAALGLSCGPWDLHWGMRDRFMQCRFSSCPAAYRILVPQSGIEPVSLHWEVDSQPLDHQGSPSLLSHKGICHWESGPT